MKQTPKYKFNLIEASDQISPAPLNANAELVEAVLTAQAEARAEDNRVISAELGAKVMVAAGVYDGNGGLSRSINTPGFTPTIVLMRAYQDTKDYMGIGSVWRQEAVGVEVNRSTEYFSGWLLWRGENMSAIIYDALATGSFKAKSTTINFTATTGKLEWELTDSGAEELKDSFAALVNNYSGMRYEWIAFGVADVELGSREGVVVNDE